MAVNDCHIIAIVAKIRNERRNWASIASGFAQHFLEWDSARVLAERNHVGFKG
jgi:hypothetical protein